MNTNIWQKVPGTCLALLLYYGLPLGFNPDFLLNPYIWITMAACAVVFLTQPKATTDQLVEKSDQHSMKYLIVGTTISQVSEVIEWAYFNQNHTFSWTVSTVLGALVMATGLGLRLWAIRELKEFFTNPIHIQQNHRLVQTGPYHLIRHPSYSGAYLLAIGIGIFLSAGVGIGITVIVLALAYRYRILYEEKALIQRFGKVYVAYMQKTKGLVPYIW